MLHFSSPRFFPLFRFLIHSPFLQPSSTRSALLLRLRRRRPHRRRLPRRVPRPAVAVSFVRFLPSQAPLHSSPTTVFYPHLAPSTEPAAGSGRGPQLPPGVDRRMLMQLLGSPQGRMMVGSGGRQSLATLTSPAPPQMQAVLSNPQILEQVMASNPALAANPEALGEVQRSSSSFTTHDLHFYPHSHAARPRVSAHDVRPQPPGPVRSP